MMIPEPTGDDYDLQYLYEDQQKCVQPDNFKCSLIRRAYHAERERDALRARVEKLENLVEDVLINERNGLLLPIELAGGACEWHARRSSLMELEAKGVAGE